MLFHYCPMCPRPTVLGQYIHHMKFYCISQQHELLVPVFSFGLKLPWKEPYIGFGDLGLIFKVMRPLCAVFTSEHADSSTTSLLVPV